MSSEIIKGQCLGSGRSLDWAPLARHEPHAPWDSISPLLEFIPDLRSPTPLGEVFEIIQRSAAPDLTDLHSLGMDVQKNFVLDNFTVLFWGWLLKDKEFVANGTIFFQEGSLGKGKKKPKSDQ